MQNKISNKTLVLIVIFVLFINSVSTLFLLYRFKEIKDGPNIITGKANFGNISLVVGGAALSITLNIDAVDFGSGYVNTSKVECTDFANLTAAERYYDINDCWTDETANPRPLLLENTGQRNASIHVSGPNSSSFFRGYSGSNEAKILFRIRNNETNACPDIPASVGLFNEFNDNPELLCENLKYFPDDENEIAIDFQVLIPSDLNSGIYENRSIEFTASIP